MAQTGQTYQFTPEVLEEIETLASQGLTQEQIAYCIDLHPSTLSEKKKEIPEVAEAIKRGRTSGIQKVTNALFDKAMGGDNVAMIFFLKNRDPDNWRDRTEQKVDSNVTLTAEHYLENLPPPDDSPSD